MHKKVLYITVIIIVVLMGGLFIFEKISTGKYQKGLMSGQEIDLTKTGIVEEGASFSNKKIDTVINKEKGGEEEMSELEDEIEE